MTATPQHPTLTNPLLSLMFAASHDRPDDVAVVATEDRWTWARLATQAIAAANILKEVGVEPGSRVLLVDKNGPAHLVGLLACGLLGAIFVPVNWRLADPEIAALVTDAACPVLVSGSEDADRASRIAAAANKPCCHLLTRALLDAPATLDIAREPGANVLAQLYTSGTTGQPKGALFGPGNLQVLMTDVASAWDLQPSDVSLGAMPLFHMGGLAWAIASLARGARLVLVSDFVPGEVVDTCQREAVTTAFFVPAMIQGLLDFLEGSGRQLDIRRLTYSGSPIPPALLQRVRRMLDADLCQIYGMTEATGAFAQLGPSDHIGERSRSVGLPYRWTEVKLVDPVGGMDVGPGTEGEIWTRSAQNFLGYHNRPEETAAALTPDGWLRTGDIGTQDPDGYLVLLDRRKDMIISGGENVYPAEVERVLAGYKPILEVAVVGVPSERWGETVKAFVVPRPGHTVDADELIAFTRQHLAAFKCPTSVDVIEELPHTATGKIRKDVVRAPYWTGHARPIA